MFLYYDIVIGNARKLDVCGGFFVKVSIFLYLLDAFQ